MSGLPKNLTQQELESLFNPFGRIITSRILCDNITGTSKRTQLIKLTLKLTWPASKSIQSVKNSQMRKIKLFVLLILVQIQIRPTPTQPTQTKDR